MVPTAEQLSDEECTMLGFKREDLSKRRCLELEKFGLASIVDSCLKCVKDSKAGKGKVCESIEF